MQIKDLKNNFKFYLAVLVIVIFSAVMLSRSKSAAQVIESPSKVERQKAPPSYPKLLSHSGQVSINGRSAPAFKKSVSSLIREKAHFEVGPSGEVVIALDAARSVKVHKNSKIILPVVNWESGQVPVVLLERGEVRWIQTSGAGYNIALRSDLFEFIVPEGEFVFSYDPAKALSGVKVFKGQILFSGLNAEDEVLVKAGHQASFQGKLEDGKIAYDVLLQGKKIAKGVLSPVTAVPAGELEATAKALKEAQKKSADAARKKAQDLKKAQASGAICKQPWGQFNECSYICEGNPKGAKECLLAQGARCVRHRCNANGEWAERLVLDSKTNQTTCRLAIRVGECQN